MTPEISDLVQRLRNYIPGENQDEVADRIREAADALTRLSEQIAECKTNQLNMEEELADAKAALAWQPIETAPKDGTEIWAFVPLIKEQARMKWISGDGYALWVWADDLLNDADPDAEQPTHWRPLPTPPDDVSSPSQGGGNGC